MYCCFMYVSDVLFLYGFIGFKDIYIYVYIMHLIYFLGFSWIAHMIVPLLSLMLM
jgi:hypothetical protein